MRRKSNGVDYAAVIAIGKEFNDKYEALEFLENSGILSEEDQDTIEEDGLNEWLYSSDKIGGGCLNFYSGDYYYVGYDLSVRDPEGFRKSFEDAMSDWDKYFPNDPPDVIHTVKVY